MEGVFNLLKYWTVDFDNKEDNHVKGVHDKLLIEFTDLLNGSYKGD